MAQERLEIEIVAKNADKFKMELNKARLELNNLQMSAVKAKGGTKKLNNKIKEARVTVRQYRLEYERATLQLKQHASQAIRTAGATTKLGKSQKRSNMAMTQAAYALDDMQYGFQGVMNNVQAMAVSMGAGGPLVIGITAVVVAIGYFVKKMEKANRAAKEAKKVLKEKDGLIASQLLYAEALRSSTSSQETQRESLKKLKANGYDPAIDSIDDYIAKLREQAEIESKVAMHQSKVQDLLEKEREAQEELNEAKEDGVGFFDDIQALFANDKFKKDGITDEEYANNLLEERIKGKKEELRLAKEATKAYTKANILDLTGGTKNGNGNGKDDKTLTPDEMAENFELADALSEAESNLAAAELDSAAFEARGKAIGQAFKAGMKGEMTNDQDQTLKNSMNLDEEVEAYIANLERIKTETETLRNSVGGAFADLGGIIATNLGRNGDALSSFLGAAIGTYTKLLSANSTFLAKLIPMKATEAGVNAVAAGTETASKVPFGAFVLPALIAGGLAAVSSAFSSVGASAKGGGGGGGGGRSSSTTVARPNAVRESKNARMRGSDLILPMDKIRYGQQIANDNYSGYN